VAQGHHHITTESAGAPTDVQGAEALKEISPHQFEWWAVDLVNARPAALFIDALLVDFPQQPFVLLGDGGLLRVEKIGGA
jgi:hypothetical protein